MGRRSSGRLSSLSIRSTSRVSSALKFTGEAKSRIMCTDSLHASVLIPWGGAFGALRAFASVYGSIGTM